MNIAIPIFDRLTALDAVGPAQTSCATWREADSASVLDPVEMSPKIIAARESMLPPRQIVPRELRREKRGALHLWVGCSAR